MTSVVVPLSSVNSVLHLHYTAKDAVADDCKTQNKTQFFVFSLHLQTLCRLDSSVGVDTAVITTQQDNVVVGPWSVTIAVRKHGLPHIVKGLGHIWTSSLWTSDAIYSSNHLEIKKQKSATSVCACSCSSNNQLYTWDSCGKRNTRNRSKVVIATWVLSHTQKQKRSQKQS